MEYWDIYDVNKQPTGRTMKRNDWNMKPGGLSPHSARCAPEQRGKVSDNQACHDKGVGKQAGGRYPAAECRQESHP